jgi:hypothetical protein
MRLYGIGLCLNKSELYNILIKSHQSRDNHLTAAEMQTYISDQMHYYWPKIQDDCRLFSK